MDDLGRLLKLVLSPGQSSDHTHAPELAEQAIEYQTQRVIGDKGYDSDKLRVQIEGAGLEAIIPFRKCRNIRPEIDGICIKSVMSSSVILAG